MVFGNSSHLSFCLRIEDFVKSALVVDLWPISKGPSFGTGRGSSLYRRVLVPATVHGVRELAWVYTVEATRIKRRRIVSGCWPK